MKIERQFSPNFDKRKRSKSSIKIIVIHYTGMQSTRESIIRLTNPKSKVSCHYLIKCNGRIFRMVAEDKIAWHAGKSSWKKFKNLNKNSIGIELVNKGHRYGYTKFRKKQILNLIKICKILIKRYKIKNTNIVGHSDIAPNRKIDPGEKFPWELLAKNNIGIWHDYRDSFLRKFRKAKIYKKKDAAKFSKNLEIIGYCSPLRKKSIFKKTVRAFQRHFRRKIIDGTLDKECAVIAKNLVKNIKNP